VTAAVSKTCLVRFDNNKYSVAASAVGRPVEVHAYADRTVIRQDGRIVAEHPRSFGRGETIYDPWHYVPVLARKPGALRNGAPFKDWVLPAAMERVRRKLAGVDDGNRQMIDILTAVLTNGLPAVEAACPEAITQGVHSADVILNILARHRAKGEIGGDDDRGALVKPADEMEQELAAGLGEGQIAEFIEDDEVHAGQMIGEPTLPCVAGFDLEAIDEIDHVVEPAAGAGSNAAASDGDREMAFARAGSAHEHGVALLGEECRSVQILRIYDAHSLPRKDNRFDQEFPSIRGRKCLNRALSLSSSLRSKNKFCLPLASA
jgi:hypothetical protein